MVDIGTNEYSNSTNSKIDVQFLTNLILKNGLLYKSRNVLYSQVEI